MRTTHLSRLTTSGLAVLLASLTASVAGAQVTTTSAGDVSAFSQKNLINHQIIDDSLEVEMAQLAISRSQNAAVKEFANQLLTDHSAHLATLNKLAGKSDIGREANAADTSGAHFAGVLKSLQSMNGSSFDQAFVQAQITHHQEAIQDLQKYRASAKDDDVQKDIDKTLPVLEKHLSTATTVAATLSKPGLKSDSSRMAKPPVKDSTSLVKPPVSKPPF
jgi:putative membrane protein